MQRRRYLAVSGLALATTLGGCSIDGTTDLVSGENDEAELPELPGSESTPTPEPADSEPPAHSQNPRINNEWSGTGPATVVYRQELVGATVVSATHSGDGHFSVTVTTEDGNYSATPINFTGEFRGAHIVAPPIGNATIEIEAESPWHISTTQLSEITDDEWRSGAARTVEDTIPFYLGPLTFATPRVVRWAFTGPTRNELKLLDIRGNHVTTFVDTVGPTDGSTTAPDLGGFGYLDIDTAVGAAWRVTVAE